MIKTRSQFKSRSVANNVEIMIPVPPDVDSPSFKSSVGNVTFLPDRDCVVWNIKQFHGGREYLMRAHFGLPSISASDTAAAGDKKGARAAGKIRGSPQSPSSSRSPTSPSVAFKYDI